MRRCSVLVSPLGLFASRAHADGPVTLAIGGYAAFALREDVVVVCSGRDEGLLGDGTRMDRAEPTAYPRRGDRLGGASVVRGTSR